MICMGLMEEEIMMTNCRRTVGIAICRAKTIAVETQPVVLRILVVMLRMLTRMHQKPNNDQKVAGERWLRYSSRLLLRLLLPRNHREKKCQWQTEAKQQVLVMMQKMRRMTQQQQPQLNSLDASDLLLPRSLRRPDPVPMVVCP